MGARIIEVKRQFPGDRAFLARRITLIVGLFLVISGIGVLAATAPALGLLLGFIVGYWLLVVWQPGLLWNVLCFSILASIWLMEWLYFPFLGGQVKISHILGVLLSASAIRVIAPYVKYSKILKATVSLIILAFLSALWSVSPAQTLSSAVLPAILALTSLGMAAVTYNEPGRLIPRFVKTVEILSFVTVGLSLLQFLSVQLIGQPSFLLSDLAKPIIEESNLIGVSDRQYQLLVDFGRPSGLFIEPDHLGFYLMWSFLLLLPFAERPDGRIHRVAVSAIAMGLLLSQTRAAWMGAFFGLIIYFLVNVKKLGKTFRSGPPIVAGLVFIIAITFSLGFHSNLAARVAQFFDPYATAGSLSSGAFRLATMRFMWEYVTNNMKSLLVGNGWGTLEWFTEPLIHSPGPEANFIGWGNYGPNLFLNFMFNLGLIGLALCLYISCKATFSSWKRLRLVTNDYHKQFVLGLLLTLVGMTISFQVAGVQVSLPPWWLTICFLGAFEAHTNLKK
ncbi:MAG: O-antigen ligase family protein [Bacillota bacterium]